jgi:hypothetical protein
MHTTHFAFEQITPQYWRIAFDHAPINTVTADTVAELSRLVDEIERSDALNVVVFTSRNPNFFLAHYDTEADPVKTLSMPAGPTGMHPWLDLTARLSRAPVVSIASIRARARGAGSEFVLAADIRLAGDKAILGQFEVGTGVVPGGGTIARLPRLIGRGRALEVLLGADDIAQSATATSTASSPTSCSTRRPTASPNDSRPSTSRRSRKPRHSSTRQACPTTTSCGPRSTRSSPHRRAPPPRRGSQPWQPTASGRTASSSGGWASWSRWPLPRAHQENDPPPPRGRQAAVEHSVNDKREGTTA